MRTIALPALLLASILLTACGSFEKKWDQSVAAYKSGSVKAPEGPWQGSWATNTNGHTGDLRAIVTKKPGSTDEYRFKYHATWGKIFSGVFGVQYPVEQRGSSFVMEGDHDLGIFSTFEHRGRISNGSFDASYSSKKGDVGSFSLKRPQ
jgi:hypothetical protein